LSEISKIYDPLGSLSPCTIVAKILMQQIWSCGVGWDDSLPNDLEEKYIKFRKSLLLLSTLKIPRWLNVVPLSRIQICGFCD